MSAPVPAIWRTSLIQCWTGQRLVACAAPGAMRHERPLGADAGALRASAAAFSSALGIDEELGRAAVRLHVEVARGLEVALGRPARARV